MKRKERRRVGDRKYHYTYLIRDNINNKVYYGVHSTDFDPECIYQYHSSSKHLNSLIDSLGIENFSKEVRKYFDTREEANSWESKVLRRLDAANNKNFYNKTNNVDKFYAGGKVGVRDVNGKVFSVCTDDPYIGVHYEYHTKGRSCKPHVKELLSDLYKGKRLGTDNPVHKIKDKESWRRNISKNVQGKGKGNTNGKWHEGLTLRPDHCTQERMNLCHSVNNSNRQHIYIYKGELFLEPHNIPDISLSGATRGNKGLIKIKEDRPSVPTIIADGVGYDTVKRASEDLMVHPNTITARIENDVFPEYGYVDKNIITFLSEVRNKDFYEEMKVKYKDVIKDSSTKEHFKQGLSDEAYKINFVLNNPFMEMYGFKRVKSSNNATTFEVTCPICSDDEYVKEGVCDGKFYGILPSLVKGNLPCRCGDSKNISKEVILYEVNRLCEKEGLNFKGLNGDYKGRKLTKMVWSCAEGNTHSDTTIKNFLETGARCKCSKNIKIKKDRTKVNLPLKFKERFENMLIKFNERRKP